MRTLPPKKGGMFKMKEFLLLILFLIILFVIGFCIEILRFQNKTPREIANQLKVDLIEITKGFFEKPRVRHFFEDSLAAELKTVIHPFSVCGMDIDVGAFSIDGLPYVEIDFVPAKPMQEEELVVVSNLVKQKIRHYLIAHNLTWRNFTSFTQEPYKAKIYFYYAEFDSDTELLHKKYKEVLREKCGADFGYLHDDDLDKEIKDATNPPGI